MASTYERRVAGKRLQYFGSVPDAAFWSEHWTTERARRYFSSAARGKLGLFEEVFTRHLPRNGRILEAGCGLGHLVVALRARGYSCEGVEWSRPTVGLALRHFPDLPIRAGDVTALDVPDGTYAAIISLGVVEHRQEGPEPYLKEFLRVLQDDGVLLLSVPCFNVLRRLKAQLGWFRGPLPDQPFYQQAYRQDDMSARLEREGFVVEETTGYDPALGLSSEVPPAAALLRLPRLGFRLRRRLNQSGLAKSSLAHMAMFVCRPAKDERR